MGSLKSGLVKKQGDVVAFRLYVLYLISFFLHLPARIPALGLIRFDFLLVAAITVLILSSKTTNGPRLDRASKFLLAIFVYSIVTIPLVEWPGSVLRDGIFAFIKGAILYFFTVNLVGNERRLKQVIAVFLLANLIRIVEPLLLHIVTGYWGSATHIGNGEFAGRLAGAPSDTINPNGLAFVIATVVPFLHYVFAPSSKKAFVIYLALMPMLIYTMGLTLSRSGAMALGLIAVAVWINSTRKVLYGLMGLVCVVVMSIGMSEIQKDRYLSVISDDTRQSASAEGRIQGWFRDFQVAMNRPVFGFGLGTSREANWHFGGKAQISHILWAEVLQEIGIIGLALFVGYLSSMIRNFVEAGRLIKVGMTPNDYLYRCNRAMQVWLWMNLLFSLASYGLKSYEWYFFGGLSVVLLRIVKDRVGDRQAVVDARARLERRVIG